MWVAFRRFVIRLFAEFGVNVSDDLALDEAVG